MCPDDRQPPGKTEDLLQSIFRAAPIGIGMVIDRVFVMVNERLCRMIGYEAQELIGRKSRMLYPDEEEFERVGALKYDMIRETGIGTIETRWCRKDGEVIAVLLSSSPLNPGDWSQGVTFTALDITQNRRSEEERLALEEQLRQSQKMEAIGKLAGGIAHDFNNLLLAMQGHAELALLALNEPRQAEGHLQQVQRAVALAGALTKQLLAFSRRDAVQLIPLQLNHLLADLVSLLTRVLGEQIQITFQPQPNLPFVRGDKALIEQLMMNLCINARDAMSDGGRLTIATARTLFDEEFCRANPWARPGTFVECTVQDTGCGIEEDLQSRIFEPFFSTKEAGRGTGLGLANVYAITQRHNGMLRLESRVGRGTAFFIYLPADASAGETRTADAPAEAPRPAAGTILLAEDDEMVRELVTSMLAAAGYRVLAAADGEQAAGLFKQHREEIRLAILDVVMPGCDGPQTAEVLRRERQGLPVLFISGYSSGKLDPAALDGRLNRLLNKPFSQQALLSAVGGMLEQGRAPL